MAYIQAGPEVLRDDVPVLRGARASPTRTASSSLRGRTAYVLLNLFPYNSGHLLVCPYRHIATYDQATDEEVAEIGALTQQGMRVLRQVSRCDGFNIGMNQGRVAGAGVDEHLHQHIVPRWAADANFFPIIAKTKALPQLLGDVRGVADAWPTAWRRARSRGSAHLARPVELQPRVRVGLLRLDELQLALARARACARAGRRRSTSVRASASAASPVRR